MSNLIDIQTQIQKLQKQATEIKAREFDATVRDIQAKMQAFGISPKDLQAKPTKTSKGRGRPSSKENVKPVATKRKVSGTPVAAKYIGPNGEAWSGRGLTPRWLAALLAEGRTKDEFAVKS